MAKLRINSTRTKQVRGVDAYFTPPCAVHALIGLERERIPRRLWEPACGNGAIASVLAAAGFEVEASDLLDYGYPGARSGVDYLRAPKNGADGIVTNPPFLIAHAFAPKAIAEAPYVALLLRPNFMESRGRLPFFRRSPPTRIWFSSPRYPAMHQAGWKGKKASPNTTYCWFVWQRGAPREPTEWFDWHEFSTCTESTIGEKGVEPDSLFELMREFDEVTGSSR